MDAVVYICFAVGIGCFIFLKKLYVPNVKIAIYKIYICRHQTAAVRVDGNIFKPVKIKIKEYDKGMFSSFLFEMWNLWFTLKGIAYGICLGGEKLQMINFADD